MQIGCERNRNTVTGLKACVTGVTRYGPCNTASLVTPMLRRVTRYAESIRDEKDGFKGEREGRKRNFHPLVVFVGVRTRSRMYHVPAMHVFFSMKLIEILCILHHLVCMSDRIGNDAVTAAQENTVLRNGTPLRVVDGDSEKPGKPGRPKGYPKSGGRKPGVKNRISADVKQAILIDGKPLETLFAIARGNRMKAGDPADPTRKVFVYPTLADRKDAARTLLAKVVPDLKSQELSGNPDAPLFPANNADAGLPPSLAMARRIAFLLAAGDPGSPPEPRRAAADDPAAQDFRAALHRPAAPPAPAAPPPLEPDGPPTYRDLGASYAIGAGVIVQFQGMDVNGCETWDVVLNGTVASSHAGLEPAAAAARLLTRGTSYDR